MIAEAGEGVAASAATRGSQEDGASSLHVTPTPNQHPSTVRRTQRSTPSPSARVSPYPLRERTPPQALSPSAAPVRRQARVSLDASSESGETEEADQHRLQLVVQPIVKDTVGQRDNSGKLLEVFAANGATFNDIKHKLWEKFSNRIKRIAVKQDEIWSDEDPTEAAWSRTMVFKWNTHLVSTAKSEQAWNRWVVSRRGDTVTLLIFEYGTGIPNARALEAFMQSCIRPQHTDRSGAAAEASIREIVTQLQDIWGATYQGSAVAWRMWANAIMRNLDRSTWEAAVLEPPTPTVEQLLQLVGGEAEQHLVNLTKSTRVALDIVDAAIADNRQLKRDWKAIGERMDNQAMVLQARRQTLEGMLADIPLPSATAVPDPMPRMVNVEDNEHQQ